MELARIKEESGNISDAADILQELQVGSVFQLLIEHNITT